MRNPLTVRRELDALIESQGHGADRLNELVATSAKRALNPAEQTEVSNLKNKMERQRDEIHALDREWRDSMVAQANSPGATEDGEDRSVQYMRRTPTDIDPLKASTRQVRDAALKVLETEHKDQKVEVSDESAARIERMVDRHSRAPDGSTMFDGSYVAKRLLITESPAYRSAWQKAMRDPFPAWDADEVRAINQFRTAEQSLTSASGGYGVPTLLDPTIIITSGGAAAPLLDVSRIEPVTANVWHGVSSTGVAFAAANESAEISAQQAELAQPTITCEKAAAWIPFTFEVEGDYPGFASEMARLIEVAYIDYLGEQTAVGAAGVVGVFTALDAGGVSGQEVNPTTDGGLGPEDALVVWKALPERARTRASWFMNVSVESQLRTGADGYGSRNLSSEGIGPLLGKRVLLSDYAPAFSGTTGAANLAVLMDFNSYVIAQRVGMNIERVPVVFSNGVPDGTRGYLAWARVGADSVADEDGVLLQNA